jgi:hypothetical protein
MMSDWAIRSTFAVEDPDNLRMSLRTTARMKDWEELRKQLDGCSFSGAPLAYELRRQIFDMLSQARKMHTPKETT